MRNADRVKLACLAQLVNVIAPITTNKDGLFRHTIYYPYAWALQYARGAALSVLVESPTYDVQGLDQVPYLDVAGAVDRESGKVALFVLNRDLAKPHPVEITWEDKSPSSVASSCFPGRAIALLGRPCRIDRGHS